MEELLNILCPFIAGFLVAMLLQMKRKETENDSSTTDKKTK